MNLNKIRFYKLFINDYYFFSINFFTIFQTCLEKKIFIPRFCYHSKLNIAGNCRMCLIEEKKSLKPFAACAVGISSNLILFTKTKLIKNLREGVLSYLLANHPLDCPICDQGGECDLQDQTMVFGGDKSRFYEKYKKTTIDKNLGPIKTSLNRCIHCARCTRFLENCVNNPFLNLLGRGYSTEISFYRKNFANLDLLFGNIIDLCPVGALLSKNYSFMARPWEITSINSITILDNLCSNIKLDFQGTNLLRVLPRVNNLLNEEWICDKTRFFLKNLNYQRLIKPFILNKKTNLFIKISWLNFCTLFFLLYYQNYLISKLNNFKHLNLNVFLSTHFDLESLMTLKIFNNLLGQNYFFNNLKYSTQTNLNHFRSNYLLTTKTLNWKESNLFFLINLNLRYENPVLWLKLKNIINFSNVTTFSVGFLPDLNYFSLYLGNNIKILLNLYEFNFFSFKKQKKTPLILIGSISSKLNYLFLLNLKQKFKKNFYYNYVGLLNAFELNVTNKYWSKFFITFPNSNLFINYFINFDQNDFNLKLGQYNIYQGNYGNYLAEELDILLPTKTFLENSSYFLNIDSWVQKTDNSLYKFSLMSLKFDKEIFQALIEFCTTLIKKNKNLLFKLLLINKNQLENIIETFFNISLKNFFFIKLTKSFFPSSTLLQENLKIIEYLYSFNYFTNFDFNKTYTSSMKNNITT